MSRVSTRTIVAIPGAILFVVGLVASIVHRPFVLAVRGAVTIGVFHFWTAACLVLGLVLLVLALAIGDTKRRGAWSALILAALWVFQFSGLAGIWVLSSESPETQAAYSSWWNRLSSLNATWWSLAVLLAVVVIVAVVSRRGRRRSPAGQESEEATTAGE